MNDFEREDFNHTLDEALNEARWQGAAIAGMIVGGLVLSFLIGVLLAGCVDARPTAKDDGDVREVPTNVDGKSLGRTEPVPTNVGEKSLGRAEPVPTKNVRWLTWDSVPGSNITYNVWHSTDLKSWSAWTNVDAPPVAVTAVLPREFFMVRSSNTVTHLVSEWAGHYGDVREAVPTEAGGLR